MNVGSATLSTGRIIEGALRARETQRFDKAARAGNSAKGLVHYTNRLQKARRRGNARKIAKFGLKVQKYNQLVVAAVVVSTS